jgi:pimeloyl-ACP methyl ester carboxylesterase/DNA-binding winged helix-turn-helix (wHTH) protein
MIYRFEAYELDTDTFELRRDGETQRLEPQVLDVLSYLVRNHERLVSKDELLDKVWGNSFVSDAALNSRLMAARKAIGDNGRDQRLIRTQHGRGFRFVGEVMTAHEEITTEAGRPRPDSTKAPQQTVRFCETPDGVHIAYATVGEGPPLVKAPNWMTHLEYEWQNPVWRHWWQELAQDYNVIRFDQRGCGLSDRLVEEISFEAWVRDLESVVEAAGLQKFALLGISQGGAVALEYASRHPERVVCLVLYGTYSRGWRNRDRGRSQTENEAVLTLMREGWGKDIPVYRQLFTYTFMPEATPEQVRWFNELQRVSCSAETAARVRETSGPIDVRARLASIRCPTLVLHAIGDEQVPFDEGRELALQIPNARFVALESRNHLTLQDEPAWPKLIAEVRAFLAEYAAQL